MNWKDKLNDAATKAKSAAESLNKENIGTAFDKIKDTSGLQTKILNKKSIIIVGASVFIIAFLFLLFSGNNSITKVKDAAFPLNKRFSYGEILENYRYVSNPVWSEETLKDGEKLVLFRAKYANSGVASGVMDLIYTRPEQSGMIIDTEGLDSALNSAGVDIYLLIQFRLSADGESVGVSGFAFDCNGKIKEGYEGFIPRIFESIAENKFLPSVFTDETYRTITFETIMYYLKKTIDAGIMTPKSNYFCKINTVDGDNHNGLINITGEKMFMNTESDNIFKYYTMKEMENSGIRFEITNLEEFSGTQKMRSPESYNGGIERNQIIHPLFVSEHNRIYLDLIEIKQKNNEIYYDIRRLENK